MKCLVTGAAGFIGSHLCEALVVSGHQVSAFIHYNSRGDIGNLSFLPKKTLSKITIIKGDIQDPFSVDYAIKRQDYVFHLAALIGIPYSYVSPASYVSVNVHGALNVLEAARKHKVKKVVHTSTSETYGSAIYVPIDEKHPLQGQSPYSASKIGADQLAESYFRAFGLPVTIIRPFNTFGPRQSSRALIPTIISQLLSEAETVKLGSTFPMRDFNYIKDTVDGFIKIAISLKSIGKVLNIGSGKTYTVKEIFNILQKITGINKKLETDKSRIRPEKSEVKKLLCDYSMAKEIIGYRPQWRIEEGLGETIEFIRENLHLYKLSEYAI